MNTNYHYHQLGTKVQIIIITIITRSYIWEILHSTIRKMSKHVARLQKDMVDSSDTRRRRRGGGGASGGVRRASDESESDSDNSSDEDTAGPRPTEEEMESMEEKLETAQADQKNLFLIIFQVSCFLGLLFFRGGKGGIFALL